MPTATNHPNVATSKQVRKLVTKAYRALNSAETAMLDLREWCFTPAERRAFKSIVEGLLHGAP